MTCCKRSLVTTCKFHHVLLVCALGNNGRKKEPAPAFRPKKLAPADLTGARYDGSLLNALKTLNAIQSTFRSLEMHSKRRFKIRTCSVILGELESFRYKVFSIILSKILDVTDNVLRR